MTQRLLRLSSVVLVVALLAGCGTLAIFQPPTKLTVGEELDQLGKQFLETAKMYNAAYEQGVITKDQYAHFAEFVPYFKVAYGSAVTAYEAGTKTPSELRSAIRELNDELTLYALSQLKKK